MRRKVVLAGTLGTAIAGSFVIGLGPAAEAVRTAGSWVTRAAVPETNPLRGAAATAERTVAYRGLAVPVPQGWPVYRLDEDPGRCVRFDQRAIYLGRQGIEPDCPAHLVGRTEAVQIEPLDAQPGEDLSEVLSPDALAEYTVRADAQGEVRLRLPAAGVRVIGSYGSAPGTLQSILRGSRVSAPPEGTGTSAPAGTGTAIPRGRALTENLRQPGRARLRTSARAGWVVGRGFDTCTAPSIEAMRAWRPVYQVANIYIGGIARGCAQPNLTPAWVQAVRAMGYRLVPTYVGLQAPCTDYRTTFHWKDAGLQGRRAATDAMRQARALGIPRKKPIYYDMEAYDSRRTKCREAVLEFVHSWSKRLLAKRYTSGFYSSVASGIVDVGRATGIIKPKSIWFAHWDGKAQILGSPYLPDTWWVPHRRIKQYRGGHRETHNGVTINIDSNIVDGRVF